jgi:hypothetical protein
MYRSQAVPLILPASESDAFVAVLYKIAKIELVSYACSDPFFGMQKTPVVDRGLSMLS